jgi:hypothetical protein
VQRIKLTTYLSTAAAVAEHADLQGTSTHLPRKAPTMENSVLKHAVVFILLAMVARNVQGKPASCTAG